MFRVQFLWLAEMARRKGKDIKNKFGEFFYVSHRGNFFIDELDSSRNEK